MAVKEIKYTSADYATLLQDLINEIKKTGAWKDTDFRTGLGRTLLELFAYTADQNHFYLRRVASEGYVTSAKVRNSFVRLGKLIGYSMQKPIPATTTLRFRIDNKRTEDITINQWTRCQNADGYEYLTTDEIVISSSADATSVDVTAVQGKRVNEKLGTSDGSINQQFPLTYENTDTYMMSVYVGKEGYTIVPDWVGYYRPVNTYTTILSGADWQADTLFGIQRYKATITHNLDLIDPNLFSITAIDGTTYDGTQISFVEITPTDENVLVVYDSTSVWRFDKTPMLVDIKDDLDSRVYYPSRSDRVDNKAAICVVDYRDEDSLEVQFGDGAIGKIPPSGDEIRVSYVRNDGASGNAGANSIITIMDTIVTNVTSQVVSDITLTNITEASGGADIEDLEHIRRFMPLEARSLKRMVTLEDYHTLISRVHGVLKTQVLDVYNPGDEVVPFRTAKVYIIPVGGGKMSNILRKTIEDEIDRQKIVGTFRVVEDVTYDSIKITMNLWTERGFSFSTVRGSIVLALNNYFAVDHATREIGDDVDYENLLLTLTEVTGVGSITLSVPSQDTTVLDGHYPRVGTLSVTNKGVLE